MTRFIAIDPSSTVLGYAIFDGDPIEWGVIDVSREGYATKYAAIVQRLEKLRLTHGFAAVAMERAFKHPEHNTSALQVAVATVRQWAKSHRLRFDIYSPSTWKRSARVVCLHYRRLGANPSEHITDAVGLGLHHAGVLRLEEMAARGK